MANSDNKLTEGEWTIVRAVWANEPCAAPTVQEVLEKEKGWSYSTVKTMMDRMAAKDLLKIQKVRNLILYSSAVTEKQAQKGEIMRVVKRAFDGALTPMMQFMLDNNLSEKQLNEVEAMIKKRKQGKRKNKQG